MVFHVNWFQDFMNQYQSLNDPANRILFVAINNPLMSDLPRVIYLQKISILRKHRPVICICIN